MSWSPPPPEPFCTLGAQLGPEGLSFSSSSMPARWCWRKRESLAVSGAVAPAPSPARGLARGSSDAAESQLNPSTGIPVLAGTGAWAGTAGSLEPGCPPAGRRVRAPASAPLHLLGGERVLPGIPVEGPHLCSHTPVCRAVLTLGAVSAEGWVTVTFPCPNFRRHLR